MPKKIDSIGAPSYPSGVKGLMNQMDKSIGGAGESPKDLYDRRTQAGVSKYVETRLIKSLDTLNSNYRKLLRKEAEGRVSLGQDFVKSVQRARENYSVAIARAHGTVAVRDFGSARTAAYRKLDHGVQSGRYDRIQFAQVEVGNMTSRQLTDIESKRQKALSDAQKAKSLNNQESKQVIRNSEETVKELDREKVAILGDVSAWKKKLEVTTQWSNYKLRTRAIQGIEVPELVPRMMPFVTRGAKAGMRALSPFGAPGQLIGAAGGGLYGTYRGLRAKFGSGGSGGGDAEAAAALSGNPYIMAAGAVAGLGKGIYNLVAGTAFPYERQGIIAALQMGKAGSKNFSGFTAGTGLSLGLARTKGLGIIGNTPNGKLLNALGFGPQEALDLVSAYGGASNIRGGGFSIAGMAKATRSPYLAGIPPEMLAKTGQFGFLANGKTNEETFRLLAKAVSEGTSAGMSQPDTARAFLGIMQAMSVGSGLNTSAAGGLYNSLLSSHGSIAAYNTPEGMIATASALAHSGSRSIANPFGFALLQSTLQAAPGKNIMEKIRSILPRGAYKKFLGVMGGLPGFKKDFMEPGVPFMSTLALGNADLLGGWPAIIENEAMKRQGLKATYRAGILTNILGDPNLATKLANAKSYKEEIAMLSEGGKIPLTGDKGTSKDPLKNIDENVGAMLKVLNTIATAETIQLNAAASFNDKVGQALRTAGAAAGYIFPGASLVGPPDPRLHALGYKGTTPAIGKISVGIPGEPPLVDWGTIIGPSKPFIKPSSSH